MKRIAVALCLVLLVLVCINPAFARRKKKKNHHSGSAGAGVVTAHFKFQRRERMYLYEIPPNAPADKPLPAIVVIHRQGAYAQGVMRYWKNFGRENGIIIISPEAQENTIWKTTTDGAAFLHSVVFEVNKVHPIDPQRVYLFGNQGGGTFATIVGLYDSTFWAATATQDGVVLPNDYYLFKHAAYKEPFFFWYGRKDPRIAYSVVTNEAAAFKAAGFPFDLDIRPFDNGSYQADYSSVNAAVWAFFQKHTLPASIIEAREQANSAAAAKSK